MQWYQKQHVQLHTTEGAMWHDFFQFCLPILVVQECPNQIEFGGK